MKLMTFDDVLRSLGHIYEPRQDEPEEHEVRHILKVYVPTGNVQPRCGANEIKGIGCSNLYADSNCPKCRELEGIKPSITKRSLMLDIVNALCDFEQGYLDAMYWNFHNRDKEPINPDPDGELAGEWRQYKAHLISMVERFEPTMNRHEMGFGWPEDLEDGE